MSPDGSARAAGADRLLWWAAVGVILGFALVWRLPATDAEWRLMLCESDSLYQLHRVEQCLAHYPLVPSIDRESHFPRGYRVPWIALHTVVYATLARVAGIPADNRPALVAVLSWVPPLVGVLSVFLTMAVAGTFTRNRWCVAAVGAMAAVSAETCRVFLYGTIDHHLWAHLGVLLLVWARLVGRRWAWLLGLAMLFAMTPEAIIYVTAIVGCALLADLCAAVVERVDDAPMPYGWYLAPAFVCGVAWLLQRCVESDPLPAGSVIWMYFSLFHVVWFGLLGTGGVAAVWWLRLGRQRSPQAGALRAAAALGVLGAACVLFLYAAGALATIAQRLAVTERIFVAEENFVFAGGFWRAPAWYRILTCSGLFLAAKLVASARRRAGATEWFAWPSLTAALVLGFKEFRHLYVLSGLQLVGLGVAAFETAALLRRMPLFASRAARLLPGVVIAAAIAPALIATDVLHRAAVHGAVCGQLPLLEQLADWLRGHTENPYESAREVAAYGVFSPWSIGHHIHILGERPVVVDPLNYDIEQGLEGALDEVWGAGAADELVAALRRYGVRYLVLTNPAQEIVGVARRHGLPKERFAIMSPDGAPLLQPAMNQFAAFRLFMTSGLQGEFGALQARFLSVDSEHYTARDGDGRAVDIAVPAGQIYELKPGAVITGAVPRGAGAVVARYTVRRPGADSIAVEVPLPTGEDGRFHFRTSLPAPNEESSFALDGPYVLTLGSHSRPVPISQAMIDHQEVVEVTWPE